MLVTLASFVVENGQESEGMLLYQYTRNYLSTAWAAKNAKETLHSFTVLGQASKPFHAHLDQISSSEN